jgi:hypothetical protein
MLTVGFVSSIDPFEHRQASFRLDLEPAPVQQFTFQRGEKLSAMVLS